MRLHRLEVEGFGPFRERQHVDFDAFAADGIFLIAGRTGAGKSSILDAVCFGLYGGVPRYATAEKRLRSDHSAPGEPSQVVVEFSTTAGRFRVTRSPEYLRPAKRGGGMTAEKAAAQLEQLRDGEWIGLAARVVDVAHELDAILQLTQEQFLQVILLAQNRFADFLLADSKDRQKLLRRLFGTARFEEVQNRFDERRRESEQALSGRNATVLARVDEAERIIVEADLGGTHPEGDAEVAAAVGAPTTTEQRIEQLGHAVDRAQYRVERRAAERDEAEAQQQVAEAALVAAKDERHAQIERDRARAALVALDAQADDIVALRDELARARAAEVLRAPMEAARISATRAVDAADDVGRARSGWADVGAPVDGDAAVLRAWASERTSARGGWQHAADLEARDAERAAALAAADAAVTAAEETIARIATERAQLPAQQAALTDQREQARRDADRLDDARRQRDEAEARRTAVSEEQHLRETERAAEETLAAVTAEVATAQSALAALRQRRLDGFAGELASALVDGEACAVCGSTAHPQPAEHADPVSAEDVSAAEAARDRAAIAEKNAAEQCAAAHTAVVAAAVRTGGRTAEQARAEYEAAEALLVRATEAQAQLAGLEHELDALRVQAEASDSEHATAAQGLSAARETLAALRQSTREADDLIAAARGHHESVAARMAEAMTQITAADTLATAIERHTAATRTENEARAALDAALSDSDFADAEEAQAALRAEHTRTAHEQRIAAYGVQHEKERQILFDLELRVLPEEPIDLAPVELAATEARAAWMQAVTAAQEATLRAGQLQALVESAASEFRRGAEQTARHEVLAALAATIKGTGNQRKMDLETFVLAAELEEIVAAANVRLHDMSAGRYQLEHTDERAGRNAASGLRIVVYDAFTGQTRPPQSLSGGETFLSSLALALGLAEVVTARAGGIQLDTLFIDEGFGSLDADTLEVAMRTLDELRQGGRTVGVISHVEAMQEAIPAQITVRATTQGPSVVDA